MAWEPPAETRLVAIGRILGHKFNDPDLLTDALSHASVLDGTQERVTAVANERLEFLGDALLGAAVALALYRRHPDADEGSMSRAKSRLVSRHHLARCMDRSGLLPHCLVGAQLGDQWPVSVKANLAEALLGAIHMDGGWDPLVTAVHRLIGDDWDDLTDAAAADAKNRLQILCLERYKCLPTYKAGRRQ
jgi:ribonuclease-3